MGIELIFGLRCRVTEKPFKSKRFTKALQSWATEIRYGWPEELGVYTVGDDGAIIGARVGRAPVVYETEREVRGVLARRHPAVPVTFHLADQESGSGNGVLDELPDFLRIEPLWREIGGTLIDERRGVSHTAPIGQTSLAYEPEPQTPRWYVKGEGALVYGCVLPSNATVEETSPVLTFQRDPEGEPMRLVGTELVTVNRDRPLAIIQGDPTSADETSCGNPTVVRALAALRKQFPTDDPGFWLIS